MADARLQGSRAGHPPGASTCGGCYKSRYQECKGGHVTSPFARQHPDDAHPRPVTAPPRQRRVPVVLVVDDTSDTLELYSLYLTGKGFKVPTARDGRSGIDA